MLVIYILYIYYRCLQSALGDIEGSVPTPGSLSFHDIDSCSLPLEDARIVLCFILHFPDGIEHLFICLLAIWIASSVTHLF